MTFYINFEGRQDDGSQHKCSQCRYQYTLGDEAEIETFAQGVPSHAKTVEAGTRPPSVPLGARTNSSRARYQTW